MGATGIAISFWTLLQENFFDWVERCWYLFIHVSKNKDQWSNKPYIQREPLDLQLNGFCCFLLVVVCAEMLGQSRSDKFTTLAKSVTFSQLLLFSKALYDIISTSGYMLKMSSCYLSFNYSTVLSGIKPLIKPLLFIHPHIFP